MSLRQQPSHLDRWYRERPFLLDLFCGAGGVAEGYVRAGFRVIGVDIHPQPNYPYEFFQCDARRIFAGREAMFHWSYFAGIHASPPCQTRTAYKRRGGGVGDGYEDMIGECQEALRASRLPYVIENVPGAPLEKPVTLCGSMFGLDVRRHRLFETNWPLTAPACSHGTQKPGRFPGATNRKAMSRATVEVGVWRIPLDVQKRAMGIDREITLRELSEAIPPAYTEHIGSELMGHLGQMEVAA